MKLKRSDVFGLEAAFNSLMETLLDPEVAYKVASNGILANELAEMIRKTYKSVEGYEEIEKWRSEIVKEGGGKRQQNGSFTIPADKAKIIGEKIEALNEKNKGVIENQAAYQKKFDELLDKETDVDFKTIDRKELTEKIEPGKLVLMIKTGILTDGNKQGNIRRI
jgi:hypothetical protein